MPPYRWCQSVPAGQAATGVGFSVYYTGIQAFISVKKSVRNGTACQHFMTRYPIIRNIFRLEICKINRRNQRAVRINTAAVIGYVFIKCNCPIQRQIKCICTDSCNAIFYNNLCDWKQPPVLFCQPRSIAE